MSALRLTFRRDVFTLSADNQRHDWRWTLTASNGRIVGASSEAYRKRLDAVKNAALVLGMEIGTLRKAVEAEAAKTIWVNHVARLNGPAIRVEVQP